MGICIARNSRTHPVEGTVVEPGAEAAEEEKLPRGLTVFQPPESITVTTHHTLTHEIEPTRGLLLLSSPTLWFDGSPFPLQIPDFSSNPPTDFPLPDLGIATLCKKGRKVSSFNQDDYCIAMYDSAVLIGVFDGHGPAGHKLSSFVSHTLPKVITNIEDFRENPVDAVITGFQVTQNELFASYMEGKQGFEGIYSGTTATLALLAVNKLTIGHIGDCRAVLCQLDTGGMPVALCLTQDHNPNVVGERERIESAGGEIRALEGENSKRVFFQGRDVPGLAITRAFGDVLTSSLGVISTPDLYHRKIEPNDEFLLICSDGVWEVVSAEDAVALIWGFKQEQVAQAAEELGKLARKGWLQRDTEMRDDITVVIAYLHLNVD